MDTRSFGGEVRWLVQRVSSGPKPEEILAAQIDTGAGAWLEVRTWDARRWSDDTPAVLTSAIAPANAGERGFDVRYEGALGHALLVRADGAPTSSSRRWSRACGASPRRSSRPRSPRATVLWTELVPRTGTDEIALVALDDRAEAHRSRLGRHAVDAPDPARDARSIPCATSRPSTPPGRALSGDLLVAWGYSPFLEETRYATLTRHDRHWTTGQFVSTDALGKFAALASDPTSDRIIGIFGEGFSDDDVGVSVWGGENWHDTAEMTLYGLADSRAMEVGWLGTSGLGFAVCRDQAQTGAFQWAFLNGGGWHRAPEIFLNGVGKHGAGRGRASCRARARSSCSLLDERRRAVVGADTTGPAGPLERRRRRSPPGSIREARPRLRSSTCARCGERTSAIFSGKERALGARASGRVASSQCGRRARIARPRAVSAGCDGAGSTGGSRAAARRDGSSRRVRRARTARRRRREEPARRKTSGSRAEARSCDQLASNPMRPSSMPIQPSVAPKRALPPAASKPIHEPQPLARDRRSRSSPTSSSPSAPSRSVSAPARRLPRGRSPQAEAVADLDPVGVDAHLLRQRAERRRDEARAPAR